MVVIPSGTFVMGVPAQEDRKYTASPFLGWSAPQHPVTIKHNFALGAYDVTRAEFAAFITDTGYKPGDNCAVFSFGEVDGDGGTLDPTQGYSWNNPGFKQTDRDPVVCVNSKDALAYTAWLSRKTGHHYRLPSEAEWEYSARAGSTLFRPWGDTLSAACRYANVPDRAGARAEAVLFKQLMKRPPSSHSDNFPCSDGFAHTSPGGSFPANAFGLYDMLGNAGQMVADCWHENYQGAPADGSAWKTGCKRNGIVMRGGSYGTGTATLRFGWRVWSGDPEEPSIVDGFRVARDM